MRTAIVLAAAFLTAGVAVAQQPAAQPRAKGYLTDQTAPRGFAILPREPREGTERYAQDRAIFKATRALEGTDRWKLAQNDVALTTVDMLRDFSCSMGVTMTQENAPKLYVLLRRAAVDSGRVSNTAKDEFKRKRPYFQDEGPTCTPRTEGLDNSYDYPSGHATLGWTLGLILAEIAPDRSTPLLARGRAFGESRVVCGVHNASAIEGARTAAASTVAAMHGSAEFRADVEAARAEVAALRAGPPGLDAAVCQKEAEVIADTPYPY